jgi:uncharacterized protein YfcZ (UPF0381/DUF406 family)
MIGYKLFKVDEENDKVHMLRIVDMHRPFKITDSTKDPSEITIYDYEDDTRKKVRVDSLKEYSPLKPDGIMTFSIVTIRDEMGKPCNDVIVTASKFLNIELKLSNIPYAVCRQNINDIFYSHFAADENDTLVGLAVNQDTCPSNFDYRIMFAADEISRNDFINFYRSDTLDDILKLIKVNKYNEVLKNLFLRHIKYLKKPELQFKSEVGGWCRDLKTLLTENNFQADINQMLDIMQVDFNLSDYFDTATKTTSTGEAISYTIANNELMYWLSIQFKANMSEVAILEYDHDINLGSFQNSNYIFIRDNTDKLYFAVYKVFGEYFEKELEEKAKRLDFSTKFKMAFIKSKYDNN